MHKIPIIVSIILLITTSCQELLFDETPDNTNINNFELLWKIFDTRYCFFEEKHINWDSIHVAYRSRINNGLSSHDFFVQMASMLGELKDGHVGLESNLDTFYYLGWKQHYPANYISNSLGSNNLSGMNWTKISNNTAYIKYPSFSNQIDDNVFENIFVQIKNCKGLIIDIRNNGGGNRVYAEAFVSKFIESSKIVGYSKEKRGSGHNDFTDFSEIKIEPTTSNPYKGIIVILTNRSVFSAANLFVSEMKVLPNVITIGDQTGGGGGIPISSELLNGWRLKLSIDPLFNIHKESIEEGIPPDIAKSISKTDEKNGFDRILNYAIAYIEGM